MLDDPAKSLRQLRESLAVISLLHLHPVTRQKLADNDLSVNAYPDDYGGFIHVGSDTPTEPDLAAIFKLAVRTEVTWLRFDGEEAGIVGGLPLFADERSPCA